VATKTRDPGPVLGWGSMGPGHGFKHFVLLMLSQALISFFLPLALCAFVIEYWPMTVKLCDIQLQLYTAKSQYWLHKAGASPEHWQLKNNKFTYECFNENIKSLS